MEAYQNEETPNNFMRFLAKRTREIDGNKNTQGNSPICASNVTVNICHRFLGTRYLDLGIKLGKKWAVGLQAEVLLYSSVRIYIK
jgi:hypothetical protein